MKYPRLAVLGCVATLAFCGVAHAIPAQSSLATVQPASVVADARLLAAEEASVHPVAAAQPSHLEAGAVQVAVNTFDGPRPLARSVAVPGPAVAPDAVSSYLHSATRYVQDVGSFWSRPATAPKIAEVPLPGALWLFASALLAFLALSVRRKF